LEHSWQEIRYALRHAASLGFTAIRGSDARLGHRGYHAISAVVDATLLQPLPDPQPESS